MSGDGDQTLPEDFMRRIRFTDEDVPQDAIIPPLSPAEEIVYLPPQES